MPQQHKTGAKGCQPALTRARCRRPLPLVPTGDEQRPAAIDRRKLPSMLLLASVLSPNALAETAIKISEALGTAAHIQVSARRAGGSIFVSLRIEPGYHINANPASNDYLIPTTIAFRAVAPAQITYPPAILFKPAFSEAPINVYEGAVVITARFPPAALDQVRSLNFTLTAQACTEEICLPPDDISGRAAW